MATAIERQDQVANEVCRLLREEKELTARLRAVKKERAALITEWGGWEYALEKDRDDGNRK